MTHPGAAAFSPDSMAVSEIRPSPNRNARRDGRRPDLLLLHYTGMASAEAALARLCDPDAEVSAHYVVREDGRVVQLVPERERAWHAGVGSWAGETDVNSVSIGIEIVNRGHEGGCPAYPAVQVEAVIRLSRDILGRWAIPAARVLAHSDVAPARKEDPGEHFPWAELHANGVGHWVDPVPPGGPEAAGPAAPVQEMLARYGYALAVTGTYDAATAGVLTAFQRHFRPRRVDGIADASTVATLAALLAALPPPVLPARSPPVRAARPDPA